MSLYDLRAKVKILVKWQEVVLPKNDYNVRPDVGGLNRVKQLIMPIFQHIFISSCSLDRTAFERDTKRWGGTGKYAVILGTFLAHFFKSQTNGNKCHSEIPTLVPLLKSSPNLSSSYKVAHSLLSSIFAESMSESSFL